MVSLLRTSDCPVGLPKCRWLGPSQSFWRLHSAETPVCVAWYWNDMGPGPPGGFALLQPSLRRCSSHTAQCMCLEYTYPWLPLQWGQLEHGQDHRKKLHTFGHRSPATCSSVFPVESFGFFYRDSSVSNMSHNNGMTYLFLCCRFSFSFFLRQGLTKLWIAWNSLCRPACP